MKLKLLLVFSVILLLVSCGSKSIQESLTGKWKVTEMVVDIPNAPKEVIEAARTIALATTYDFKEDLSYALDIEKTEVDLGRKEEGSITVSKGSRLVTLSIDKISFPTHNSVRVLEKNEQNAGAFKSYTLKVEKISSNQLTLLGKEAGGQYYYTLKRAE